jgi:hypothetical protein
LEDEIYGKFKEGYSGILVDGSDEAYVRGSVGEVKDIEYIIIPSETNKVAGGSSVPSVELYPVTAIRT